MSQGFHHEPHGIYGFNDGFERPTQADQSVHHDPAGRSSTNTMYHQTTAPSGNASGNMLSDMFNFSPNISATDLLANQISAGNHGSRLQRAPPLDTPLTARDWYAGEGLGRLGQSRQNNTHAFPPELNGDSTAAMQLYMMNPPPSSVTQAETRLPSPLSGITHQALPLFNHDFMAAANSFPGEGQSLSLSLSSSMQRFEIAKAEELRAREDAGLFYYNNDHNPPLQHQLQVFSNQIGTATTNILRHSKYSKVAQELLEEFCSVVGEQMTKGKKGKRQSALSQIGGGNSSSSKDQTIPSLPPSDRLEHQRRKVKLLSMLDEIERRYNHYCEQMQMVVNSFDTVMGFRAATPYTGLAQKTMSRHFRCLKDAIASQLKHTCELLGERDATEIGSGITKGETPRLKLLDQNLRQQRSFHQMGMVEQEAWRPQRGLPERSVNCLRAWLFEHFLHPYPSDADKQLLARQTGLTRNQVSNWFINARVRLWKPMVEEMYLQESKEEENKELEDQTSKSPNKQKYQQSQNPKNLFTPLSIPKQQLHQTLISSPSSSEYPLSVSSSTKVGVALSGMDQLPAAQATVNSDRVLQLGYGPGSQVRFGTHGDVSLTLGLRQTGNMQDQNSRFSFRDFHG